MTSKNALINADANNDKQDIKAEKAAYISPLAPKKFPNMPQIAGVKLGTGLTGLRYKNRDDLLFSLFEEGTQVAGVFTKSLAPSAAIEWCKKSLKKNKPKALVVNAGNANAFTGKTGDETIYEIAHELAEKFDTKKTAIFQSSTGVIGVPLNPKPIIKTAIDIAQNPTLQQDWLAAAKSIMTTDTFPKIATKTVNIGDVKVNINGIAKGSGMIAPNMATMLAYIFTDANIEQSVLQHLLDDFTPKTFNAITVDSDTSTSDTLLLFATGKAGNENIKKYHDDILNDFKIALHEIMLDLAQQIVKDGEGATKFVTVEVTGAKNDKAAHKIAMSIANSPLVKTAIAGEDPNWGRVVAAIGKAGEKAERDLLAISFGDFLIAKDGQIIEGYDEKPVAAYMKEQNITIKADLALSNGKATVYTCDLTEKYIQINADYRS